MVRLLAITLKRIFAPNGTHCKLWQVLSVQDDGSVWKKIIKMWEKIFVLWQITFLTWEKSLKRDSN